MKTNLFRKFKWYIVGFIMVVIMLSVGLSFCTWDDLSVQALKAKLNTGGYDTMYKLVNDKYSDDKFTEGQNSIANVGDIVTFGEYYQESASAKSPLCWIVVDSTVDTKGETLLTLLTESVVAFGSFWGTYCYNASNNGDWATATANKTYYQNYGQSTIRAWLNSYYNLRNDGGTAFFENELGVFKGFFMEAFNKEQREYIQQKEISGVVGSAKSALNNNVEYCETYPSSFDKVWLPSYSEVFGNTTMGWSNKNDGMPNRQFSYFGKTGNSTVGKTTAYASSSASNYTYRDKTIGTQNWQNSSKGSDVWWWLRSPDPNYCYSGLVVYTTGLCTYANTYDCSGGVRPAICVQL